MDGGADTRGGRRGRGRDAGVCEELVGCECGGVWGFQGVGDDVSGLFLCVYGLFLIFDIFLFFFSWIVESGFLLSHYYFVSLCNLVFVGLYERGWKERGFEY